MREIQGNTRKHNADVKKSSNKPEITSIVLRSCQHEIRLIPTTIPSKIVAQVKLRVAFPPETKPGFIKICL